MTSSSNVSPVVTFRRRIYLGVALKYHSMIDRPKYKIISTRQIIQLDELTYKLRSQWSTWIAFMLFCWFCRPINQTFLTTVKWHVSTSIWLNFIALTERLLLYWWLTDVSETKQTISVSESWILYIGVRRLQIKSIFIFLNISRVVCTGLRWPLLLRLFNFNPAWISDYIHYKVWD